MCSILVPTVSYIQSLSQISDQKCLRAKDPLAVLEKTILFRMFLCKNKNAETFFVIASLVICLDLIGTESIEYGEKKL